MTDPDMTSDFVTEILGQQLPGDAFLSAELLQANSADETDQLRLPSCMVCFMMI